MENLELKKQERSFLKINRIVTTIIFGLILVGITVTMLINSVIYKYVIVFDGIVLFLYLWVFLYQGAAYKRFSYAMNQYGLYINQGVVWQRKIVVPRNRVQHTDVIQGPLERKFKLAELVVHTAGTRNASVKLPGILHTDAEALRESLTFEESNDAV